MILTDMKRISQDFLQCHYLRYITESTTTVWVLSPAPQTFQDLTHMVNMKFDMK